MAVAKKYDDRIVVAGTSAEPSQYTLKTGKTYMAAEYEGNGGAVYVDAYGIVSGENVTFKSNCVTDDSGKGGAVYNGANAVLTLTGATFADNAMSGTSGHGAALYNAGEATLVDTTLTGNGATMGGALFNNGGTLTITGGTVSENSAKYGGALQDFGGGTVTISGTVFSNNTAAADGGAVVHYAGTATITGATFSGNTARSSGGAIYNTKKLYLADTTFSGNSAKHGGAIYNTGTISILGTVTLATASDDFYNAGTLDWNLAGGTAAYGALAGYQYLENDGGTLAITVADAQEAGAYTIATGDFSTLDGKDTFTLTGAENQGAITINGEAVVYNDRKYTLATDDNGTVDNLADDKLVLTVAQLASTVADAAITVDGTCVYNGKAQEVAVTVTLDGKALVKGTDYTLAYADNVNAGTATVTVTGIGSYAGTKDATFTISAKELTVAGSAADGKIYDGTTVATVGTVGTLSGVIAGDDVSIASAVGEFDGKDAGNGRSVLITYTLAGEDAANYTVVSSTTSADIEKRSVTLRSADDTREYNGEPLANDTVIVSGDKWVDGEGATYNVTGSQTEVGSSANAFTYALYENTSADNYDITAIEGVLTVTAAGDNPSGGGEGGDTPPEKPDGGGEGGGGDTPPEKPDGGGEGGGEGGGDTPPEKPDGGDDTTTLKGVLQIDSGTEIRDGGDAGATLASTASDENVVLVQNGASLTLSNYTLSKSGDCSSEDNSNFYAVNAVVAAKSAAKIYIDNTVLDSNAEGANGLFASGEGSTIYAYNCSITSKGDSSRGLDATYEGTVIASKMTITTSGSHCAALATDRGDGNISVTDSTLSTAGNGSPLIYSTGIIEVDNVTGTATGSQIAGIEGLSTIRIKNSNLSGSGKKASEPVANGVIIYQSMSGDSTEGTATFEAADSTLKSAISGGAMFYVTNTSAVITVQNCILDFDSGKNYLLKAAGNDGSNGWGTAGANGADVVFTAIGQTLSGNVSVDGISSLDMYLVGSAYTGTFELDTTYTGTGGTDLFISADSTWTVTGDCTLQNLTVASGATIVDGSGKTVSIVNTSGTTLVSGTGELVVTVSAYTSKTVEALHAITDFEIDRSAFEEMYSEDEPLPAITIIAASASKMYDGTALSDDGYTFTDGVLADGDILTATVAGSITDAGTASNKVTSYKVMRGTEDVTGQYTFNDSVDGTLTVTRRDVTLTSASDSKAYDGTALTNNGVTVSGSGFVSGQGATYDVTGAQTEVGSSANSFTYALSTGTKSENYDITTVAGVLSVTKAEIKTPQFKDCVTDGNVTAVSWIPASTSEVVDIALNAADSADEKLIVRTDDEAIELYSLPGDYDVSLKDADDGAWAATLQVSGTAAENPTAIVSAENDVAELFFVHAAGTWNSQYQAHHVGSVQDWTGTDERVELAGKNKIADTFTGSSDANIMYLTDDANGDALFVDDIFTAFPETKQARIAQIDEIRAGAGDDIVDMTSQSFEYTGDGLTIRGGAGDDVIWANKGANQLFGDAGNDRIVGASGNDVIAGGTGDDSMHGGGGNDIFCFCGNWGEDTVEQLASGSVTLWFASGSEDNWNQDTMTYTDGDNSVKVTGISQVTLKFGSDDSAQYAELLAAGAFMEESSDKIFETQQKGVLATI